MVGIVQWWNAGLWHRMVWVLSLIHISFVDVYQGLALVGALSALLVLLVRKVRGKPVLH